MPGLVDPRLNSPAYRRRLHRPAPGREGLIVYEAHFIWEASAEHPNRVENYLFGRIEPIERNRVPQNLPVPRWRPQGPNAGQGPEQQQQQQHQPPAQEEQIPRRHEQLFQQLSNRTLPNKIIEEIDEIDR
ncbi:uncharacterized protein LOC122507777 [Leptopilina heterotoma]|uniref:uncharacterized protein LOC122507777 n=1 Tax=Leptopilina heterotoma TaxID=63436 RepID=UPI001CA9B8E9|nr:uncharacterized protein LOC122507777 [Leptopilina heterotoma]